MPEEKPTRPPAPPLAAAVANTAAAPLEASGSETDPRKLTPEEQMALFEKDLKENDWGHQPC